MIFNKYKSRLYRKHNTTCHNAPSNGFDYTPLYKFLLSKVGQSWSDVFKEAKARLNSVIPIYYIVSRDKDVTNITPYVRVGESSYYSTLYVDDKGVLRVVDPNINETTLKPSCDCCTHTFNGKRFTKKYRESSND